MTLSWKSTCYVMLSLLAIEIGLGPHAIFVGHSFLLASCLPCRMSALFVWQFQPLGCFTERCSIIRTFGLWFNIALLLNRFHIQQNNVKYWMIISLPTVIVVFSGCKWSENAISCTHSQGHYIITENLQGMLGMTWLICCLSGRGVCGFTKPRKITNIKRIMPQSHCPESTPEQARMNHSSWFRGSFMVIPVHSYTFEHYTPVPQCRIYSQMRTNWQFNFVCVIIPGHSWSF